MKAIILAAGRGSRMGEATNHQPKCLVSIAGKPLIGWILDALQSIELDGIGIVRGYCKEKLDFNNVTCFDNELWQQTNMVSSLVCAEEWLSTHTCLVSYSDIIYTSDIIKKLAEEKSEMSITYDLQWYDQWNLRFENPLSDAESFKLTDDGFIYEIGKKNASLADIEGQYMGLLKISPGAWRKIKEYLQSSRSDEVSKMDMTSLLSGMIARGFRVKGVPVKGGWVEIDSSDDLNLYRSRLHDGIRATSQGPVRNPVELILPQRDS